jgi:crotonobetainyl-CoA:carnitine CoA-transferase CaiB-like acyl-CoA transferase
VSAPGPLAGVRVLDLSRILAGPWSTMTLADLGAEVWKVEPPGSGDDTRGWRPPAVGGEATYYLCCNRGKRGLAVDLGHEAGRRVVQRLAAEADVLVENFRAGGLDRFGLDYASVRASNPRVVYCSVSGFGRTGSLAARPGYDFLLQAEAGLMSITGEAAGEPMRFGVAVVDIVTGMNATQAILAALFARERTGEGQRVEVALYDSAVQLLANVASGYLNTGVPPRRHGNAHPTVIPYQVFPTADGDLVLAVGNDRQFAALCRDVLDAPDLAEDGRFGHASGRIEHREALVAALSARFRARPTAAWLGRLHAAGIPAGRVRTVPEVFAAPETEERGLVVEAPHPTAGSVRMVASPLRLDGTPVGPPTAPPLLGEHTEEVLRRVLGLGRDEIDRLRAERAIG